ncbi:hypothetical protein E1293_07720 [Actinomadura darangshiensis]|uniref:Poly(3-hydroxybutyrate) depolymerase n=1 Tax=Actinomadura darangshiensis TaxID=705336 RepID=A0A4R5BTJ4_9ACTN|nr:hypothetical protein [Actinomadura darangshiensis]TDD87482.1 hypothetical protein E1293_07720 [Actinomadura darangshiensis]
MKRLAAALSALTAATAVQALPAGTPVAHAETLAPDRITVTAAGTPAYRLQDDLSSGGITVTETVGDYTTDKIVGQGALPGTSGGTAQVGFQISRSVLTLSGTFTLHDPGAGVQITANVLGGVRSPSDGTVTWQGKGTVERGGQSSTQTVSFTVSGGPASPDVDDPGFVNALQDILIERFNADPRRLYASGMSNGGFFTSKMACENQRFAAYAPVSGQLEDQGACHPGRHVPMLMIHGDGDFIVPYSGATSAAPFWARNNGCAATTTDTDLPDTHPDDNTTVTRHTYNGCPADAPVLLYQIKGGGHNWPGGTPFLGPFLGGTTYDIDANEVIWNFVSNFRLPR